MTLDTVTIDRMRESGDGEGGEGKGCKKVNVKCERVFFIAIRIPGLYSPCYCTLYSLNNS